MPKAKRKKVKIAVVDDDPVIHTYINIIFEDSKFDPITILDSAQATARIKKNKPDFVFLDIVMPYVDGPTVLKRLRSTPETSEIPVVFISSLQNGSTLAENYHADGFIQKPFERQDIEHMVEKLEK